MKNAFYAVIVLFGLLAGAQAVASTLAPSLAEGRIRDLNGTVIGPVAVTDFREIFSNGTLSPTPFWNLTPRRFPAH